MGGVGGGGSSSTALPTADPIEKPKPKRTAKGGGMKIGKKKTATDSFLDKLESEGVHVAAANKSIKETAKVVTPQALVSFPLRIQYPYKKLFRLSRFTFESKKRFHFKPIAMVAVTNLPSLV